MNESSDLELVEEVEDNYVALLCVFLILIGVTGNSLVCLAVSTERRLQTTTNYFLLSLAVVDLLVSVLVMPLCIQQEFRRGGVDTGFGLCLFQVYADVLLCSASIVHMSVISLDRYLGIAKPLSLRAVGKAAVLAKIVTVWVIAVAISSPIAILAMIDHKNIYSSEGKCEIHNSYYKIIGSVVAFYIPLFIMIIAYRRTTNLLNTQALLCQRTDDRGLRRTITRSTVRRKASRPDANSETNVSSNEATSRKNSEFTSVYRNSSASLFSAPSVHRHSAPLIAPAPKPPTGVQMPALPEDEDDQLAAIRARVRKSTATLLKIVRKTSAHEVASEQKATRVLGLVFTVFFVCWFPFFSTNVILACCSLSSTHGCPWFNPSPELIALFAWLGYISSVANPIIYTVFNKHFRIAFYRLIRCRLRAPSLGSRHGTLSRHRGASCSAAPLTPVLLRKPSQTQMRHNGTHLGVEEDMEGEGSQVAMLENRF